MLRFFGSSAREEAEKEAAFEGEKKCFRYMSASRASEGKIELTAEMDGLFKSGQKRLFTRSIPRER